MKPLLTSILTALVLAAPAAADLRPDPDPSVPPGTRQTIVGYTINLPAYTADGKRLRGWHFHCRVPAVGPRHCRLVRG